MRRLRIEFGLLFDSYCSRNCVRSDWILSSVRPVFVEDEFVWFTPSIAAFDKRLVVSDLVLAVV